MKRVFSLFLIGLMFIGLTGCGDKKDNKVTEIPKKSTDEVFDIMNRNEYQMDTMSLNEFNKEEASFKNQNNKYSFIYGTYELDETEKKGLIFRYDADNSIVIDVKDYSEGKYSYKKMYEKYQKELRRLKIREKDLIKTLIEIKYNLPDYDIVMKNKITNDFSIKYNVFTSDIEITLYNKDRKLIYTYMAQYEPEHQISVVYKNKLGSYIKSSGSLFSKDKKCGYNIDDEAIYDDSICSDSQLKNVISIKKDYDELISSLGVSEEELELFIKDLGGIYILNHPNVKAEVDKELKNNGLTEFKYIASMQDE